MLRIQFEISQGGILINILVLSSFFAPAWAYGGPPKVLYDISKRLVERGHRVTVFTTNAFEADRVSEKKYDVLEGIDVRYLKNLSNWLAWNQKIFLPLELRNVLRNEMQNFDCAIFQGFRNYPNFLGYRQAGKTKIPYILLPYGQLQKAKGTKKLVKQVFDLSFGYDILNNASRLVAQNFHEKEECLRLGVPEEKVDVIPLGIDMREFRDLPEKGILKSRLGAENGEEVVLFLGRIHRHKGLDVLLQALSALRRKHNLKFAIVGRDDGYLSSLNKLISSLGMNAITSFLGPLYGRDRISAYVDADVFVICSSIYEETPLAALEACAAGTPVIVTKQASIPWLEEYEAGLTVDCNVDAVKDALGLLLENDDFRRKSGRNARRLIEDKFDWNKVIVLFEKTLQDVVS
jgi:glycosyltransferase involved in cell wall biosynthesis